MQVLLLDLSCVITVTHRAMDTHGCSVNDCISNPNIQAGEINFERTLECSKNIELMTRLGSIFHLF